MKAELKLVVDELEEKMKSHRETIDDSDRKAHQAAIAPTLYTTTTKKKTKEKQKKGRPTVRSLPCS